MTDESPGAEGVPAGEPPTPEAVPAGEPQGEGRLLTIGEASATTGVSRKALARRVERGTLQAVKREGKWAIPRGELQRAGLLDEQGQATVPGGEVVLWRDLFEQEREKHEETSERALQLERDLIAVVNAGPIRALRLRRQIRSRL